MAGYDGSPIGIVHADMTLTRSKVKARGDDCQPPSGTFLTFENTAAPEIHQCMQNEYFMCYSRER